MLLAAAAAAAFAALAVRGFWIEPRRVEPVPVSFRCGGGGGLRVFLFSDVGFRDVGRRERALLEAARRFDPHVVLVAGDFFDDRSTLGESRARALAAEFLASLPARAGRFAVAGEAEAAAIDATRDALGPRIELLVNDSRRIEADGSCLDLFGSLEPIDAPPWGSGIEAGRPFVASRNAPRRPEHWLRYAGAVPGIRAPCEATLSFRTTTDDARVAIEFAGRIVRLEPPVGAWCRARVRVDSEAAGTRLRARFWVERAPEPAAWSLDTLDPARREDTRGTIGLGGLLGETRYADVEVRDGAGATVLRERFDAGWPERWDSGSALGSWLARTAGSPCARVVLVHNPDVVRRLSDSALPLPCAVLAGHTHGGQIRLPGVGALYTSTWIGRRFDRGLFDYQGVPLYITAGVGTTIVPIRLFDPPEVTLLTLEP